jgi:pimeloyl-ACP methyl ester carboxylesterase
MKNGEIRSNPDLGKTFEIKNGKIWGSLAGKASPTVVFLSGAGTVGLDYYELQQKVSNESMAFIYDRMGIGYSSPCILPRTSLAVTEELHELLEKAQLPKPFILVGHSLGGLYARHFATKYQQEVLGLVLLDPAHEDYNHYMPDELNKLRKIKLDSKPKHPKIYKSSGLLLKIASNSLGRKILGLVPIVRKYQKIYRKLFTEALKGWPNEIKEKLIKDHESIQWLLSGSREAANVDDLYEEIRTAKAVPNVPTTILCSMEIDDFRRVLLAGETDEIIAKEIDGKNRLYREYLSNLTEGKLIELNAGHVDMPFRQPDAVALAIRELQNRRSKI